LFSSPTTASQTLSDLTRLQDQFSEITKF
jgi:hypothetical protein